MKMARSDLLQKLLCVSPGIAKRETIQQSACVVLRRGRFYTLSSEIACSIASGLPSDWEGAIRAEKLIDLLEAMTEEEVEVDHELKTLQVRGKHKRAPLVMEDQVVLPVDEVERPRQWTALHEDFVGAVDLVHRCTKKRDEFSFTKECVHVHPDYLEACDNVRMVRYTVPVPVAGATLVRGETLRSLVQLGVTRGSETAAWLHFRNPLGLRLSLRRFVLEDFPPLEQYLLLRGRPIRFPPVLMEAVTRAGILNKDEILIRLSKDKLVVEGISQEGSYREWSKMRYNGPDICFGLHPKLIEQLLKDQAECEVTDTTVRVSQGNKFIFCASVERKS